LGRVHFFCERDLPFRVGKDFPTIDSGDLFGTLEHEKREIERKIKDKDLEIETFDILFPFEVRLLSLFIIRERLRD